MKHLKYALILSCPVGTIVFWMLFISDSIGVKRHAHLAVLTTSVLIVAALATFAYCFRLILAHEKQREDRTHNEEMEEKRHEAFKEGKANQLQKDTKAEPEDLKTLVKMVTDLVVAAKDKTIILSKKGKEETTSEKLGKTTKVQVAETLAKLNAHIDQLKQSEKPS